MYNGYGRHTNERVSNQQNSIVRAIGGDLEFDFIKSFIVRQNGSEKWYKSDPTPPHAFSEIYDVPIGFFERLYEFDV